MHSPTHTPPFPPHISWNLHICKAVREALPLQADERKYVSLNNPDGTFYKPVFSSREKMQKQQHYRWPTRASVSRHFTHNLIGSYLSFFQIKRTLLVCLYHIALNSTDHLFFKYTKAEKCIFVCFWGWSAQLWWFFQSCMASKFGFILKVQK